MRGAFDVRGTSLRGHIVLLVDDVMTTGATVNSCARTLKQAGAKDVFVLTLARAEPLLTSLTVPGTPDPPFDSPKLP